jgi:pyruvate dehydrogenase E2 component (dihydrolipoamide acetyltransferase)
VPAAAEKPAPEKPAPVAEKAAAKQAAPKATEPKAEKSEPAPQAKSTAPETAQSPAIAGGNGLPPINEPGFSRAHAGPSVRKFARELGVDLTQVKGGGEGVC